VDLTNVGMIERRDCVSFLLETRHVLALKALDGDDAVEARVAPCRPLPLTAATGRSSSYFQLWIVINVPDCVDTPPYVAVIVWSPLPSDAGTVTLN
jgi:hypothetical protein